MRQPLTAVGRLAARTGLRLTHDERPDSHRVGLATALVLRTGTAHPPK
ncbi:hypothetical protein ACFFKE_07600 [Streptomyces mutabilis]